MRPARLFTLALFLGLAGASIGAPAGPAGPAETTSVPPCTPLVLRASAITGRPPLRTFWTLPGGRRFRANPLRFDPGRMAAGVYTAVFTATSRAGTATRSVTFTIESLRFRAAPATENLGGLEIRATARTLGATELQWLWGDGTSSAWLQLCDGLSATYRYAKAGTYTLRARARNCRDPVLESPPVAVTVTTQPQPKILTFAAEGCRLGFCLFPPGATIRFQQSFEGSPSSYLYDWDGNGTFEQVAGAPVLTHTYPVAGIFTPVVKVLSGPLSATRRHAAPILIENPPTTRRRR